MGNTTHRGFTIIEVMLFLAVTGALAVAILVGSGVAINQQRYKDSVNTMKSFLQTQYSEATNVTNSRTGDEGCSNAVIGSAPSVTLQPRGTSDCIILGRYITIDATGTKLTASDVVGSRLTNTDALNDLLEIKTNYVLGLSTVDQDESDVEWGSQIVKPSTTTAQPLSILIIRSPLSGSIMTFVYDGVAPDLAAVVSSGILPTNKNLCINAEPGSFVGKRQAVRINAFAASQSAIEIPSESESVCDA